MTGVDWGHQNSGTAGASGGGGPSGDGSGGARGGGGVHSFGPRAFDVLGAANRGTGSAGAAVVAATLAVTNGSATPQCLQVSPAPSNK